MPHLTIEYSANLDPFPYDALADALTKTICPHPTVRDESDVKLRIIRCEHFKIGTGSGTRAFVHAQLRLMTGRPSDVKTELADRIADVLRRMLPRPAHTRVDFSVEIAEMEREFFRAETIQNG